MKVKYSYVTGETVEVEVEDELGAMIVDMERKAENLARKERYHCYSLDAILYEGEEFADNRTPETECINKELDSNLQAALDMLTEPQKRRLLLRLRGMSMREIAELEGISAMAVSHSFKYIQKKLKNFYK